MDSPPRIPVGQMEHVRGEPWLQALDAMLAGLAAQQPLANLLDALLGAAAHETGSDRGFLRIADSNDTRIEARASLGAWTSAPAGELEWMVERAEAVARAEPSATAGSELAVPILVGSRHVGVLAVGITSGRDQAEAVEALARFAKVAAVAFEHYRLIGTERAAREREQALRAATQVLSATLRLPKVLETILGELQNVVRYDTASVQQLRGERMVIVGGRGIDLEYFLGLGFPAYGSGGPNSDVLLHRGPVVVPDILGEHPYPDFPHSEHALSGVRSWLGVPLLFGSKCIGMITLDKLEPGFYSERDAEAAMAFAAQAAIALENARLYEQSQREVAERARAEGELCEANHKLQIQIAEVEALEGRLREQAIRDPLTGLFNRRHFLETLHRELARARREGQPLSLALIDIDHFKEVNDAWGHDSGDRVLADFGTFLLENTRDTDFACRYGGEEFIVLLPAATGSAASARADAWRLALQQLRVAHSGQDLALTISIGVAEYPTHALTADDLIRLADVALYQAKREGRDRVVLAR